MVVQNISANGKETDLTFTIKSDDLSKTKKIMILVSILKYRPNKPDQKQSHE